MPGLIESFMIQSSEVPSLYRNFFGSMGNNGRLFSCTSFPDQSRWGYFIQVNRFGFIQCISFLLEYRVYGYSIAIKKVNNPCKKAKKRTQTGIKSSACVLRRHHASLRTVDLTTISDLYAYLISFDRETSSISVTVIPVCLSAFLLQDR